MQEEIFKKMQPIFFLHKAWINGPEIHFIQLPSELLVNTRIVEYQSLEEDHVIVLSGDSLSVTNPVNPIALVLIRKRQVINYHDNIEKYLPSGIYQNATDGESLHLTRKCIIWKVETRCILVFTRENASFICCFPKLKLSESKFIIRSMHVPDPSCDKLVITVWDLDSNGPDMRKMQLKVYEDLTGSHSSLDLFSVNSAAKVVYPYIMTKRNNFQPLKIYNALTGVLLMEFESATRLSINVWKCGIVTLSFRGILKGFDLQDNPGLLLFEWRCHRYYGISCTMDSIHLQRGDDQVFYWNRYYGEKSYDATFLYQPRHKYAACKFNIGPLLYYFISRRKMVLATSTEDICEDLELYNHYSDLTFDPSGKSGIKLCFTKTGSNLELYIV